MKIFFLKENTLAPKCGEIALLCSLYNLHFIKLFLFFLFAHFSIFFYSNETMLWLFKYYYMTPLTFFFSKSKAMIHYVQNVKWRK